ncbi:MAG: hypothetical protein D3916_11185 [Candidatus Electrothrix sp. MAN1_4]|nr:hypothetical protein [Candidatus Electrothrix sp. MAN1_4]
MLLPVVLIEKEGNMAAVNIRKQDEVAARTIDLRKKVSLAKSNAGLQGKKAQVEFVLDISGSFSSSYRDNIIQDIVERLAPIALEFDDDGIMPVTLFGVNSHQAPEITQSNLCDYVNREVVKKYKLEGGTQYAKPLWDIVHRHFSAAVQMKSTGKGSWFGKKMSHVQRCWRKLRVLQRNRKNIRAGLSIQRLCWSGSLSPCEFP